MEWSRWGWDECAYFATVSMFTIGLGDYVPAETLQRGATLLYLLLGLVITTSSVDLFATHYFR